MAKGIHITTPRAQATVLLSGGCITGYDLTRDVGRFHLLRPISTHLNDEIDPRDTSCFPLVPYSNRIKAGQFSFVGESYQLPRNFGDHPHSIHGVGWQMPWQVTMQEDHRVTLELDYDGAGWPFPFHASQTYTLDDADLRHELTITNTSEAPMPAGLGMHPYFPRHDSAVLEAGVDSVWLTNETGIPTERIACADHWTLRRGADVDDLQCDNPFEPWNGRARIEWPNEGVSMAIIASPDLDHLVVYAPAGEDFFCVEPVSHLTDAINRPDNGMRVLEPNETWSVWIKLSPETL